jgi:phosphocarrier protein HPr
MSQPTATRKVIVTNPHGLHARPADMLAKVASRFQSQVEIIRGDERIDGRSILAILTLAATQGTELVLEARGPDAQAALDALAGLFENNFAENQDETSDPSEAGSPSPKD